MPGTMSLPRCDPRENIHAYLLDAFERLSERVFIAVVHLDVVPRCGIRAEPNCLTDDKGDRLSFGFSNALGDIPATRRKVEPQVREFTRQNMEFLGL
jgi:hypothetical protein